MATAPGFDESAVAGEINTCECKIGVILILTSASQGSSSDCEIPKKRRRVQQSISTSVRKHSGKSKIKPTALIICERWECDLQGGVAGAVSILTRLLHAIGMVVYCTLLKTNPTINKEAKDMGINLCLPSSNCYEENIKPDPSWLETHEDFYPDIQQINDVALVIGFGLITSRAARRIKNVFQNALFQVVNLWSHDLISERTLGYSVQKFRTQSVFLEKDCKEAHIMTSIGSDAFEYFQQAFINCNTGAKNNFKIFPIPADKYFNLSAPTAKQNGLVHILSFLEEHETEDLTGLLYLAKVMAEVTECFVKMFSKPPKWKVLGVPPGKESAIQQRLETHRKLEVTCFPITSLKQFENELLSSHLVLIPPKSVNTLDLTLTSIAIGVPVVAPVVHLVIVLSRSSWKNSRLT
ncbi:uncharacterized protein [Ptychodera flava]|uniref:uncharacterized protein n=1 Tax=Ptychodera flava TaxID=63121 RepID=UPI00396A7ED3